MRDIKGKTFNRLTVLEYMGKTRWKCKCECGNTTITTAYNIINGRTKSCGCLAKETAYKLNLKKYGEAAFTNIYCIYRLSAKNRGHEFNLTKEKFKELVDSNCFYCGAPPANEMKNRFNNGSYFYNGIDRINNNLGYEPENVVPCCWKCNEAKKGKTVNEFLSWVRSIALLHPG